MIIREFDNSRSDRVRSAEPVFFKNLIGITAIKRKMVYVALLVSSPVQTILMYVSLSPSNWLKGSVTI